jgi:SAM-dependent methyltransferase
MSQSRPDNASLPNATAETEDFEFTALREAANYRKALLSEFGPYLSGCLIEIGAGIGQMTEGLKKLQAVRSIVSVEPDAGFCAQHRLAHPGHHLVEGIIDNVPAGTAPDAILSVNVLEHIEADREELAKYSSLLAPQHGFLCLFVPARPEIYAPIDRSFGHFRRYTRAELREKLTRAGFEIVRLDYYNFVGYFAWWFSFCLRKSEHFSIRSVRLYDRMIFPLVHWWESRIARPLIGQSLLAVARAKTVAGL